MQPYPDLEQRFRRLSLLRDATAMLQWDMMAMMPAGGAAARAEQLATLHLVCHEQLTDPRLSDLLDAAEAEPGLAPWQRANLAEMRRGWVHATALDARLVEAMSRATNRCEQLWRQARPAADFALVLPALREVLGLVREAAAAKAERLGVSPYEALLDEYEPGGRTAVIDAVFDDLAQFLPGFRDKVMARQAAQPAPLTPAGPFPVGTQRAPGEALMKAVGFDFAHGRLDTSLHPFCGGVPDDVRLTTRYGDHEFGSALMGTLHETGHALYERGLPADWRHQPVGRARGMSIHESQSLLLEMQACRPRAFMSFLGPLVAQAFGGDGAAWQPDNLHRLYTRVKPGFIRVDADEVTYPAHVILRYRLERLLVDGELDLADLPAAWNQGMADLLGIVPPSDREGCLQDIHWYDGAWGYFPTYTLGAMTAAQLFDAAKRNRPEIPDAIAEGDFAPLVGWLRENLHGLASSLPTPALVERATGRPLDAGIFKRHLETRYLA